MLPVPLKRIIRHTMRASARTTQTGAHSPMAIQVALSRAGTLILTLPGPHQSAHSLEVPADARGLEAILDLLERQRLRGELRPWLDHATEEHRFQAQVTAKRLPPKDKRLVASAQTRLNLGLMTLDSLGLGADAELSPVVTP